MNEIIRKLGNHSKGVFYGRFSTDKQNIETQLEQVNQFFDDYGYEKIRDYIDEGTSATKKSIEKRAELTNLLKDAKKKEFDFAVISSYDRIARDPIDHLKLREELGKLGIPVVIASTETFYDGPDFMAQLVSDGVSKFEADQIAQRTKDTIASLLKKGKWVGGTAPYGFRYVHVKTGDYVNAYFKKNADECEVVKEIFELYNANYGFKAIAQMKFGDMEKCYKVKSIIANPVYTGKLGFYRRKSGKGHTFLSKEHWLLVDNDLKIEPVISEELWNKCWAKYTQKSSALGDLDSIPSPKHYSTSFYFSGLLKCTTCSKKDSSHYILRNKDSSKRTKDKTYIYRYYVCQGCGQKVIADHVHKRLENLWERFMTSEDLRSKLENAIKRNIKEQIKKTEEAIKIEEGKLEDLTKKIQSVREEIRNRYEENDVGNKLESQEKALLSALDLLCEGLQNERNALEQSIKKKEENLKRLNAQQPEPKVKEYLQHFGKSFNELHHIDKRTFALTIIQECWITFKDAGEMTFKFNYLPKEMEL
ncbi:recombinase family protein [Thalassorhabdus alkalitolerans]|uniref:Recombinase family protein n=1 Tax=Thalassorhabdus alkalitolerans TaxID=2282697 RepID=A0ABW0YMJ9_9BACI